MAQLELTLTGNLGATVEGDANVEITNRVSLRTISSWRRLLAVADRASDSETHP